MARSAKEVFGILIRENELELLAFVRSCIRHAADCEEIIQETVLAAWEDLDRYDQERPFVRWLRGIAKNKMLAYARSAQTRHRYLQALTPEALDRIEGEQDRLLLQFGDAFADRIRPLNECLEQLASVDRQVIERHYKGSETCAAIAAQFEVTVEAIKKRLQRARAALRECIMGKMAAAGDADMEPADA